MKSCWLAKKMKQKSNMWKINKKLQCKSNTNYIFVYSYRSIAMQHKQHKCYQFSMNINCCLPSFNFHSWIQMRPDGWNYYYYVNSLWSNWRWHNWAERYKLFRVTSVINKYTKKYWKLMKYFKWTATVSRAYVHELFMILFHFEDIWLNNYNVLFIVIQNNYPGTSSIQLSNHSCYLKCQSCKKSSHMQNLFLHIKKLCFEKKIPQKW